MHLLTRLALLCGTSRSRALLAENMLLNQCGRSTDSQSVDCAV
jgi:hypothetical protein